jgi:hypothetical protein
MSARRAAQAERDAADCKTQAFENGFEVIA